MSDVGDRIRRARKAAGLTQPELAKAIGLSNGTISQWENNTNTPKSENLYNLAAVLGVTTDFLLYGLSIQDTYGQAIEEANKIMRQLPEEDLARAVEILRAFCNSKPT